MQSKRRVKNQVDYSETILAHWKETPPPRWLSRLESEGKFQVSLLQLNVPGTWSNLMLSDTSKPAWSADWEGLNILWQSSWMFWTRQDHWIRESNDWNRFHVGEKGTSQTDHQDLNTELWPIIGCQQCRMNVIINTFNCCLQFQQPGTSPCESEMHSARYNTLTIKHVPREPS